MSEKLFTLLELPVPLNKDGCLVPQFMLIKTDGETVDTNTIRHHRTLIQPHADIDLVVDAQIGEVNSHLKMLQRVPEEQPQSFPDIPLSAVVLIKAAARAHWTPAILQTWDDRRAAEDRERRELDEINAAEEAKRRVAEKAARDAQIEEMAQAVAARARELAEAQ